MGLFAGTQWDVPAHCDRCGVLEPECKCPPPVGHSKPPSKRTLRVRVEKRKAGRVMTIVAGLDPDPTARAELLTKLKNACGAGGSTEDENLAVQGDQMAKVISVLEAIGYRVKV